MTLVHGRPFTTSLTAMSQTPAVQQKRPHVVVVRGIADRHRQCAEQLAIQRVLALGPVESEHPQPVVRLDLEDVRYARKPRADGFERPSALSPLGAHELVGELPHPRRDLHVQFVEAQLPGEGPAVLVGDRPGLRGVGEAALLLALDGEGRDEAGRLLLRRGRVGVEPEAAVAGIAGDAEPLGGLDDAEVEHLLARPVLRHPGPEAHALRALGVSIALDDFGTGYSSLATLRALPVDTIKVDQTFIAALVDDPLDSSQVIVRSIVELAGALSMRTVAEGVETDQQARLVRSLGCDRGQGYLWSRPVPADVALTMARTAASRSVASPSRASTSPGLRPEAGA